MLKISKLKMGTVLVASLMTCVLSSTSQAAVNEKKSYESSTDRACLTAADTKLKDCRKRKGADEEACIQVYYTATGKCSTNMVNAVISVKKTAKTKAEACKKGLDALRETPRLTWATTTCALGPAVGEPCRDAANLALQNGVKDLSNDNSVFNKCLTEALN
jgi:hypothetical protein